LTLASEEFKRIEFLVKNDTFSARKIFSGAKKPEKISVSKEKKRIYVGGKGLLILESNDVENSKNGYQILPQTAKLKGTFFCFLTFRDELLLDKIY
jgi:hypothetical protein